MLLTNGWHNLGCVLQTWGNRADAFVRQAELMAESNAGQDGEQAARQAYEQSMEAYATACSLSSSEQGDDLPGLLHNWGVGLRSMAEHTLVRFASAASYLLLCSCRVSSHTAGYTCHEVCLYNDKVSRQTVFLLHGML